MHDAFPGDSSNYALPNPVRPPYDTGSAAAPKHCVHELHFTGLGVHLLLTSGVQFPDICLFATKPRSVSGTSQPHK